MSNNNGQSLFERFAAFLTDKENRKKVLLIALPVTLLLVGLLIGALVKPINVSRHGELATPTGIGFIDNIYNGLFTTAGLPFTCIVTLLIGAAVAFTGGRNKLLKAGSKDSRGFTYSKTGVSGTAEKLTKVDARKHLEVGPIGKVKGDIIGQYDEKGKEVVCVPRTARNQNKIIFGTPGAGKSFCLVKPAILQSVTRGESLVITDTKNDLYETMSPFLMENGYDVKLINLKNFKRSDAWNCLAEIFDPQTMEPDSSRIDILVDVIIQNTVVGKDDPFWGSGETNLLRAVVSYVGWKYNVKYKELLVGKIQQFVQYFKDAGYAFGEDFERTVEACLTDPDTYVAHLIEVLTYLATEMGMSQEDIAKLIKDLKHNTNSKIDISEVYRILVDIGRNIDAYNDEFALIPLGHPARTSWEIFLSGAEAVQKQFIQGLSIRLGIFLNGDLRLVLSNDDLVPRELGERRMAVFVLVPDQNRSTQVISAMLFKFLFEDLSIAADDFGADTRIPVNFIMDEFANIGFIPNFTGIMSSVRSRKLSVMLILQTVGQLYDIFLTENAGNTVISCCGTIIYLGGNDTETSEMISVKSGQASVLSDNIRENRFSELTPRVAGGSFTTSTNITERRVFTTKECSDVISSGELIAICDGVNAAILKKFPYTLHPLAADSESTEPNRIIDRPLARDKYTGYRDALLREQDANRYVDKMRQTIGDDGDEMLADVVGDDYRVAAAPSEPRRASAPPKAPGHHKGKNKPAGQNRGSGEYPNPSSRGVQYDQTAESPGGNTSANMNFNAYMMGNVDGAAANASKAPRSDKPKPNIRGRRNKRPDAPLDPHGFGE